MQPVKQFHETALSNPPQSNIPVKINKDGRSEGARRAQNSSRFCLLHALAGAASPRHAPNITSDAMASTDLLITTSQHISQSNIPGPALPIK
jgi:hypothetical protein